ncbi:hypothetical protein LINPERPRIM_LOCUS31613, partial [Linum perenne]
LNPSIFGTNRLLLSRTLPKSGYSTFIFVSLLARAIQMGAAVVTEFCPGPRFLPQIKPDLLIKDLGLNNQGKMGSGPYIEKNQI